MSDGSRSGWTGTILITTIAAMVMAILAFAMSGYRDARVSQNGSASAVSSAPAPDEAGDRSGR